MMAWSLTQSQVKWALGRSLETKLVEVMEFQFSYFKSYKTMLLKCCTQYDSKFGDHRWSQDWKRPVFISIPKKGNAKECSNYHTIALISHTSKVMFKILQARLHQYVNWELPGVQAGFREQKNQKSNYQHLLDHQKSKRVPENHLLLLHWPC